MKLEKKLKLALGILIIILISMISFGGIYAQKHGLLENVLPEYILARDLKGYRRIELVPNDKTRAVSYDENGNKISEGDTKTAVSRTLQEKINSDEVLTAENYIKSKNTIEKRCKELSVTDYDIRLDEENGNIILQLPEDDKIDTILSDLFMQGKFEIVDTKTKEVLMTNDDVDSSESGYVSLNNGATAVAINIYFNKQGTENLKNISSKYANAYVSNEESTDTEKQTVSLQIDGYTLKTLYFDTEIPDGRMQITVVPSDDLEGEELTEFLTECLKEAKEISLIIRSGNIPVAYEVEQNKFVFSSITQEKINLLIIIEIILVTIALIYMILKYKAKGILGSVIVIGYIALLLIALRYANVEISVGGLVAIDFSIILEYLTIIGLLRNENISESLKKYLVMYIPLVIISVVFTLSNILIGAVLFWAIVINLLYNLIMTKIMLK